MADIRRILLDGYPTVMVRDADVLVARDGRTIGVDEAVHLSPVHGGLDAKTLSEWVLEDRLPVRVQLQVHKYIWGADVRGV